MNEFSHEVAEMWVLICLGAFVGDQPVSCCAQHMTCWLMEPEFIAWVWNMLFCFLTEMMYTFIKKRPRLLERPNFSGHL